MASPFVVCMRRLLLYRRCGSPMVIPPQSPDQRQHSPPPDPVRHPNSNGGSVLRASDRHIYHIVVCSRENKKPLPDALRDRPLQHVLRHPD